MKIDRLVSIIMILIENKKISATKLAEMFEVTPRTIYRDIEAINQAGIPIITYPGVNGGIGIVEEYKINKKLFTTSDITTLLIGLGSISSTLSKEELVNTLAKVKGLVPAEKMREIELKSNQIAIDLTSWIGNKKLQPNLEEIKRALNESRFLSFKYSDRSCKRSNRKVEPYRLVLKDTNWYLQGYCTLKQDFRIFKLSRISEVEILEDIFIPREFEAKSLVSSNWIKKRIITIKLLIHESLRERVMEYCGEENIKSYGENKLIVDFPFTEDDFSYNIVLGFGHKCECLEPAHVREEIIQRVEKLLSVYS